MKNNNLRAECESCFGLCCVALYFSASEGFPEDKVAGKPCINLQSDFRCRVHGNLRNMGLKGCTAYDCFGAGQKVAEITFKGQDWRQFPEYAKQIYDVFFIMRQIHEMLWYLTEAHRLQPDSSILGELNVKTDELESLTRLSAEALLELNLSEYRAGVNVLLLKTSELLRSKYKRIQKNSAKRQKTLGRGLDLIGADLRRNDLRGENLRGAYLIAANLRGVDLSGADLIGADMRDADIRGADLAYSIFLTQGQISTAKGDSNTKLPVSLIRPTYWTK